MAVRVAGLAVLGVPLEVSRLLLPAEVHPEWKARLAAVERWSREVWIAKHSGGFDGRCPAPKGARMGLGYCRWHVRGRAAGAGVPCFGGRD